jgi:hypothetical protein
MSDINPLGSGTGAVHELSGAASGVGVNLA